MNTPALLIPIGARVIVSDTPPAAASTILNLPTAPRAHASGAAIEPALLACLPSRTAKALLEKRSAVQSRLRPLLPIDMDDAMRRIRPANTLLQEWPEAWIEALAAHFSASDVAAVVVPDFDLLDAPSLRIVVHAWLRAAGTRPLCLQLIRSGELLETTGAYHVNQALACLGINAAPASGKMPAAASSATAHDPACALVDRNYSGVLSMINGRTDFQARALMALVLARTSAINETAAAWRHIASDSTMRPWDRASACSSEAVCWAKEQTPAGFGEAAQAIARGHAVLDGRTETEAAHIRGWLWNNAGLVAVLEHARTGEPARLHEAGRCLARAFEEAAQTPEQDFPNLHHNLVANAIQLLEMEGDHAGAVRWLEERFGGSGGVVYEYRRAMLLARAGEAAPALAGLRHAAGVCPAYEWFFQEVIEHGQGCVLLQQSQNEAAREHFRQGLRLCARAGLASGMVRHAQGIMATTPARVAVEELDAWRPFLPASASAVRPLAKLPPYLAELDLCPPPGTSANTILSQSTQRLWRPVSS